MKSKMTAIFAILMIALMVAGFAYAHWEETITISGTVTTGTFDLRPTCDIEILSPTDKDVATVDCQIDGDTVSYTIENAFPCLTVKAKFDLHNEGVVPAGLYKWTATYDNTMITIFDAENIGGSIISPAMTEDEVEQALEDYVETTLGLSNYVDVTVDFEGSNFWQIDEGQEPYVYITIHFLEGLPEGASCSFTMTLEYWNWNEVGYLG